MPSDVAGVLRPFRVVITGSESTGKTTLAGGLAAHFGVRWSEEYSRRYAESIGRELNVDDVEPIARGQIELEDAVARMKHPMRIHDTDLISTVVYARHYYDHCPRWIEEAAASRRGDLYLLMDVDIEWAADAIRDRGECRLELHASFVNALEEFGARYRLISGRGSERLERALAAIEAERASAVKS